MNSGLNNKLEELLAQAGAAHHIFEKEELKGELDEDWPRWYAAYLIEEGIASFFQPPPGLEDLADKLKAITDEQMESNPEGNWNQIAAEKLIAHYLNL